MQTNFKEQLHDERPYWKVIVSLAVSLIGTILFIYVGYRLLAFFMPFVIGWFLAYVASPLVNWLEKRVRIVKKLGSALIIILVLAGVGLLCYFLGSKLWQEIRALIENMPGIYRDLESGFYTVGENLEGIFEMLPEGVQEGWQTMISNLDQTMGNLIGKNQRADNGCGWKFCQADSIDLYWDYCHIYFLVFFHCRAGGSNYLG